ncbi:MAG: hypothetical protein U9O18_05990 [Chloroflexota bacterium]|nr:hypothetical protein [Chloroflexota bacterium]
MSPEEYMEAFDSDSLRLSREILLYGGWVPVGIVAIVAGIVVAFISGDWLAFLSIALAGTILGYIAAFGASYGFDELDIRWLRLGRPDEAAWVIFLSVGPAVALLVAVLVLSYA